MKFNMIRNTLLALVLILFMASCDSNSNTPEDFGSLMFTSIKTENLNGYKACYASRDDFLYLFGRANNKVSLDQAEREIKRRVDAIESEVEGTLAKLRMRGVKKGIVWEKAILQNVERSRDTIIDETPIADINAFFKHDESTYKILLRNCMYTNGGWHIFTFDPKLVIVDQKENKIKATVGKNGTVNNELIKEGGLKDKNLLYSIIVSPNDTAGCHQLNLDICDVPFGVGAFKNFKDALKFAKILFPKYSSIEKLQFSKNINFVSGIEAINISYTHTPGGWKYFDEFQSIVYFKQFNQLNSQSENLVLMDSSGLKSQKNVSDFEFVNAVLEVDKIELAYRNFETDRFYENSEEIEKFAIKKNITVEDLKNRLVTLGSDDAGVYYVSQLVSANPHLESPVKWKDLKKNTTLKSLSQKYSSIRKASIHGIAVRNDVESSLDLIVLKYN